MNIRLLAYAVAAFIVFFLDRISKYCALLWLQDEPYNVTSFLSFELVMNRGVSWGMFHSDSTGAFIFVSLLIVAVTAVMLWHAYYMMQQDIPIFGHVCIIAGSISNIIDRIYYCGVIDFVLFSYNNFYWPVFNGADVAIVCGVMIMLLQSET